jgi:hypothetical protein
MGTSRTGAVQYNAFFVTVSTAAEFEKSESKILGYPDLEAAEILV